MRASVMQNRRLHSVKLRILPLCQAFVTKP